jgi:hypothetical protein
MGEGRSANEIHSPTHSLSNGHSPTFSKTVNGHSNLKSETNGTAHIRSNGFTSPKSFPPIWLGHSREEVTRILIQSLNDLGYSSAASELVHESGFEFENDKVSHFRRAVLEGRWTEAEELLDVGGSVHKQSSSRNGADKPKNQDSTSKEISNRGLELINGADKTEMIFWMRQQKYLELLEHRDLDTALSVLRHELTPLHQDTDRLHVLGG